VGGRLLQVSRTREGKVRNDIHLAQALTNAHRWPAVGLASRWSGMTSLNAAALAPPLM